MRCFRCVIFGISFLAASLQISYASAAVIEHQTLEDGTEAIFIGGEIESGDESKFRRLSIQFPKAIVALDSKGGKIFPAIEIGKMIRLAGFSTIVLEGSTCASSCALIWLAGSPRFMQTDGLVGFHASYRSNNGQLEETGVGNAVIGHYLSSLNLPQSAVIFATTASPNEILWLTSEIGQEVGIDYRRLGTSQEEKSNRESTGISVVTPPPTVRTVDLPPVKRTRALKDMTLEEFKNFFRTYLNNPETLKSVAASLSSNSEIQNVFAEHAKYLYSNDKYIDVIASELHSAKDSLNGSGDDRAIAMTIGQTTNIRLTFSGLSRLSDKDVRLFLQYITQMTANATDDECKSVFNGTDRQGAIELKLLSGLGAKSFSDYLALTRRAIFADLSNFPAKITPSNDQKEAGEKAFTNSLQSQLLDFKEAERERLSSAILDLEKANAKDACDGYYLIFRTAVNLGGLPGDWQRRTLVNSMSE